SRGDRKTPPSYNDDTSRGNPVPTRNTMSGPADQSGGFADASLLGVSDSLQRRLPIRSVGRRRWQSLDRAGYYLTSSGCGESSSGNLADMPMAMATPSP